MAREVLVGEGNELTRGAYCWRLIVVKGKLDFERIGLLYLYGQCPLPFKCRLFSYATLGSGG